MRSRDFKVGDKVFVVRDGLSGTIHEEITEVVSISPKRGDIKVDKYEAIFDRGGNGKGRGAWSRGPWLEHATPELIEEIRKKRKRDKNINTIESVDRNTIKSMSDESLELIANVINSLPERQK